MIWLIHVHMWLCSVVFILSGLAFRTFCFIYVFGDFQTRMFSVKADKFTVLEEGILYVARLQPSTKRLNVKIKMVSVLSSMTVNPQYSTQRTRGIESSRLQRSE